jgi:NTP pyrophosphatase (non-canonical NTP hydrolase)
MWDQISDLHACHREVPVEIQLLKLTEETGEAAEAFIGIHGLNSRKGVCRSRDDLLAEPADVIITAAVATGVTGGDLEEARSHLEQRLTVVTERARRRRRGKPAGCHGRKAIRTPDPLDAKGILRFRLPLVI